MTDGPAAFKEAMERSRRLQEQLKDAPRIEILGVTGALGASMGKSGRETLWTLRFSFEAWRAPGQALHTHRLMISRKVSDDEWKALASNIHPYSILRIRAQVALDASSSESRANLHEILSFNDTDAELIEVAHRLQQPVLHRDDLLGTLTLDRRINQYIGTAEWNGTPVRVHISPDDLANIDAPLKTAHALWQSQARQEEWLKQFASQKLLDLKNDHWLQEHEAPLTPNQFQQRMKLESITAYPDGSFVFFYNDGDMFWGHCILIDGNLTDGPTNATVAG